MSIGFTSVANNNKTQRLSYDINNNLIYQGQAEPGTLDEEAFWSIRKFLYDGSNNLVSIIWSDGDSEEDNIWDDRESLTYL